MLRTNPSRWRGAAGTRTTAGVAATILLLGTTLVGCRSREDGAGSGASEPRAGGTAAAPGLSAEELAGTWTASLEHEGTSAALMLELTPGATATLLRASMSIPAIDAWNQPIGIVNVNGQVVRAGPFELRYAADPPRLTGIVPAALLPVYDVPLELRRADEPLRPEPVVELPQVQPRWTFDTGAAIWAGAAVQGNTVYVANDAGVLYALDRDGAERWRFSTDGAIRADPAPWRDSILVHSDDGSLYRIDRSGELIWRAPLSASPFQRADPSAPDYRYNNYASAPVVAGEAVYVGHGSAVQALRLADGASIWSSELGDLVTSTPALSGGRLFVGSFDGRVHALSAADGATIWTHDTGAAVPSSPAVHGELVIVGSRSYDLLALNRANGTPAWKFYTWFSWIESSAVIRDATVYVGSSDQQQLRAIDAGDGTLRWRFDTGGSAWARPAVSDGAVFIGAVGVHGYMVEHRGAFLAVDRRSGLGQWQFVAPQIENASLWGFAGAAAVDGDLVVAGGLDGRLYAFPSAR